MRRRASACARSSCHTLASWPPQRSKPKRGRSRAGRNVGGDPRGLDRQRARAAHRVHESPAALGQRRPATAQQDRRREVLLQRRRHLVVAIAAPVQRLAAQVDAERGAGAAEAQADAHVRRAKVHRCPLAAQFAQPVHDRVLAALRSEAAVPQPGRQVADDVDRKRCAGRQLLLPGQRTHGGVEAGIVVRVDLGESEHDAACDPRPQASRVGDTQVAVEGNPGRVAATDLGTEPAQLLGEQVDDAAWTRGEQLQAWAVQALSAARRRRN